MDLGARTHPGGDARPETSTEQGSLNILPLVDTELLPDGAYEQRVVRSAHRWYEHLISLWAPGLIEAAFDLGFFEKLADGPLTSAALADASGTDPRATRVLLNGLCAYELLETTRAADGSQLYVLPAEARDCLLPDGLYSLGGKIGYDRLLAWDAWRNLADTVRTGSRDHNGAEQLNQISGAEYELLVRGINFWAPPIVDVVGQALDGLGWSAATPAKMLDVGCGTGLYSQLLLRRYPLLHALGFDEEGIVPLAVAQSERLNVGSRFTATACDFQDSDWGNGFDLVFMANIFHLQNPKSAQELAIKSSKALGDNGVLVIVDHIVDNVANAQSTQDRFFRLFAVSMLATGGGDAYTVDQYDQWLANAGLRRLPLLTTPMHRVLIAGRW